MPDGKKYYFSNNNIEETAEIEVKDAQTYGYYPMGSNFTNFLNNRLLVGAWYCNKIESPYTETINLSYDKVAYTYYKLAENQEDDGCPSTVSKKINKVYVRASQIATISGSHQKIVFNSGSKVCEVDFSVSPPDSVCSYIGGIRYDIDSWGNSPTGSSSSKILLSIDVSDNEPNPTKKSSFQFFYDYFEGLDYGLPSGYTYSDIGNTHKKRLKLSSINIPGGNNYVFNYLGENENIQTRLSYGVDHWGGANGNENNLNLKGLIGTDSLFLTCGSNRGVNVTEAQKGLLNKITHSIGSETILEYESNTAKNYSGNVGGLRISGILLLPKTIHIIKAMGYLPDFYL
jgi:hypothetical protein